MIVGFDVGGTKLLALLIDPASGQIAARARASSDGDAESIVEMIASMVGDLAGTGGHAVEAVGLGVAGLADVAGVVRYSPNLPAVAGFPLVATLNDRLGLPVFLGNDATTAALAESRFGAGRGLTDMVLVALGTGIGTGFVVGGRLVGGANGFAGESGHMVVDLDGPVHLTGRRGPWEYFASGTALGRLAREAVADGRFEAGRTAVGPLDGTAVVQQLAAGDPQAVAIFDEFCREVARGVADLVLILDPQMVVLGGGLADIGDPLREGVERWVPRMLVGAEHRPAVKIEIATFGSDAGAFGAALLAYDSMAPMAS